MSAYNHTGQVVTDLERAKRFYQEVFGFALWYEIAPPDEASAKLIGLPRSTCTRRTSHSTALCSS